MTDEELSRATAELLRPYFRDTLAEWEAGCVAEIVRHAIGQAVAAERERCARLCEGWADASTVPGELTRRIREG